LWAAWRTAIIGSRWPMTLHALWQYLWTTRFLLQTALLAWMTARNLYRVFPVFVLYTGVAVLQTVTLKAMVYTPSATGAHYFVVYAGGTVLAAALRFAVIYELFQQAFYDYPALRSLGITLFRGTMVLFLLIGAVMAWFKPVAEQRQLMSDLDLVDQTVCVMQCGLLIVLLIFSRKIGLSLRSRTFGIALGFGISSSVGLVAFAIRSRVESVQATPATDLLNLVSLAGSLVSVAVWTAYLIRQENVPNSVSSILPRHDLESWNQELRRLLR